MKEVTNSNASYLTHAVLAQGLTRQQAADKAGISRTTFARLMKQNLPVRIVTAFKLQQAFGSDAVQVVGVEGI